MIIHKFAAKAKGLALAAILLWVAALARPCAGQEPPPAPLAADLVKDGQIIDLNSPRYLTLFTELRDKYGFSNEELHRWFDGVSIVRRVLELMDRQAEALPYYKYYPLFIKDTVIEE
ncbi:MAG: hypothetical protein M0Z90_09730, partial [Desulfobacteraceae bacterium]|nr:hypothetical protein [Desulfobacteraceae bacterium]